MRYDDFTPHSAEPIPLEDQDESIAAFDLAPTDQQDHVVVMYHYYAPLILVTQLEGLDVERLRAEILMANYAAKDRYDRLPQETKIQDRKIIEQSLTYQRRKAEQLEDAQQN